MWSPSQDEVALNAITKVAKVATESLVTITHQRVRALPDGPMKDAFIADALALERGLDSFENETAETQIQELESQRAVCVIDIRNEQITVQELVRRSNTLEAQAKVCAENCNLQSYNVRNALEAKPSERFALPGEIEAWQRRLDQENKKMDALQITLNSCRIEYAEVNAALTAHVKAFNSAQAKEAELWKRLQVLKRTPEALKGLIKTELLKLEIRKQELNDALASLGTGNVVSLGLV